MAICPPDRQTLRNTRPASQAKASPSRTANGRWITTAHGKVTRLKHKTSDFRKAVGIKQWLSTGSEEEEQEMTQSRKLGQIKLLGAGLLTVPFCKQSF